MYAKRIIALSISTALSFCGNANASSKSHPIARLLTDGDPAKPRGSLIFSGDRLNPIQGKNLKVLCYLNYQILNIPQDDFKSQCNEDSKSSSITNCKINDDCSNTRTANQASNTPKIVKPYNGIIINSRPTIYWNQTQANSYTVILEGSKLSWRRTTKNTKLPYPEESPLEPGNVYNLTIVSNDQKDMPINASSNVLVMLPNEDIQIIEHTIQEIKNLNLDRDQEIRDIQTVYMSKNLLTKSIQVLRKRIDTGSLDPTLHRLLGDRYLQAGLPEKAKPLYTTATKLAKEANQLREIQIVQHRLTLISDLIK